MNRRDLLKGICVLPAAGIAAHAFQSRKLPPPATGTLKVILQGAFAVVVQPKKNYHVTAYIPWDAEKQHEFRFETPNKVMPSKSPYDFTLSAQGLEPNRRAPYIDHGFDDFNVEIKEWPGASNYFVKIELPAPDVISFIPPSEPVIFAQDSRRGVMQLNAVLEYRASDLRQVCMFAGQSKKCLKPLPCEELYEQYMSYWKTEKEDKSRTQQAQDLDRCAHSPTSTYFFGVGLPPYSQLNSNDRHALHFFNDILLPSLGRDPVLKTKVLQKLGVPGDPCAPIAGMGYKPALAPAVLRTESRPRLLTVASTEDCRAGVILARTQ